MTNRLAQETSPYLLQHAENPVDWYPWGEEALQRARDESKPILLSIGYSACHWCHVMERESFEDDATAQLMNQSFVNIKVDREERPDLDEIYMKAVQAFTGGHGGWPMTVFLTPEGKPFYGGTYFPPTPRGRMPSFQQVIRHVDTLWRAHRDDVDGVTGQIQEMLDSGSGLPAAAHTLEADWLERFSAACEADFDPRNAGFGGAPKFPPHGALAALLAAYARSGSKRTLQMVTRTLDGMAKGGMYDLIGGGFARYSVDAEWRIPHFEKMLYDNGQLVPVYTSAWQATKRPHYARIVRETLEYVVREMTLEGGAFAASQDADSEGEEGKFFVWTPADLVALLGVIDGPRAASLLQVTPAGTFEHGTSALRLETPLEGLEPDDQALIKRAFEVLGATRSERIAPGRDDKVITAWNAMMISSFAKAGRAFHQSDWIERAEKAARFLLEHLVKDGRLQRTYKDGRAHLLAYQDDYALLTCACVDLYEATFESSWLTEALRLAEEMTDLFWDEENGGFYYTGTDAEELITRSKHFIGGAEPSGNGAAALAFSRLAMLCDRPDLGERADAILKSYQPLLERAPRALGIEVVAAAWRTGDTQQIGRVGGFESPTGQALDRALRETHLPFAVFGSGQDPLLPWMNEKTAANDAATVYVCEGFTCKLPAQDAETLGEQLTALQSTQPSAKKPARVHAPDLPAAADDWLNVDAPLSLADLKGNVVVLDFWTYCCINCLHVLPELAAIEEQFEGKPVVVIGVHAAKFPAEKERENVARAVERHRIQHPVVLDPEHTIWKQYAIRSWPTVVVIGTDGRIVWQQPGEVSREVLADVVERALEEAQTDGTLGEPAWARPTPAVSERWLCHPGKVAVFPNASQQVMDADCFNGEGRLYVADTGNDRILEAQLYLDADGWPRAQLLRSFGGGEPGLVDGSPDDARFFAPQGLARSGDTLWVADTENHCLRAIDLESGQVRTVAGTGRRGEGIMGDPDEPRAMALRSPWAVECNEQMVLVAMAGTHQVWLYLTAEDSIFPVVGSGVEDHIDGDLTEAALAQPSGLCWFGRYVFVADSEVSSVRVIDLEDRKVGTVVGAGLFDFGDTDGPASQVRLQHALGVTVADGGLYVADTFNHKVKRIDLEGGETRTIVGGTTDVLCEPGGIDALGSYVVVADTNNHRVRVVKRDTGEIRDLEIVP